MLVLKILLGLILFVLLVLLIPVNADIAFDTSLSVTVKWLFLKFRIYPAKEKPKKEKTEPKAKPAKEKAAPEKKKNKLDAQTILELIEFAPELLASAGTLIRKLMQRLTVKLLHLRITVRGEDAHQTAESFGRINAGLHGGLALLRNFVKLKRTDIQTYPDFCGEGKSEVSARAVIRTIPARIIGAVVSSAAVAAFKFLKLMIKSKQQTKHRLKGGTLA